jgi:hypothetical protein
MHERIMNGKKKKETFGEPSDKPSGEVLPVNDFRPFMY